MSWQEHSLFTDEWGVRVGDPERPWRAFAWSDVTRICAYAVAHERTRFHNEEGDSFVVLEIHHGDSWEEVLSDWKDFGAIATGLSAHLPALRSDWLSICRALSPVTPPLTIWESGE